MLGQGRWLLWLVSGVLALGLDALGAVLPLLPTMPFLLPAAIFFARSCTRLHGWLLAARPPLVWLTDCHMVGARRDPARA